MLLQRSVLLEVYLLLAVSLIKAEYGFEKEEKSEGAESRESPNVPDHPDYYKLFAADAAAPVYDYTSFIRPSLDSGESKRKAVAAVPPFTFFPEEEKREREKLQTFESKEKKEFEPFYPEGPVNDFYEEYSKKPLEEQQSRDEEVIRPGPSYVSHQVPAYKGYEVDEDKSATSDDAKQVPQKANQQSDAYGNKFEEGRIEKDDDDYQLPKFTFEPLKNDKPKVNYDTGKSSSTVSQYPAEPEEGKTASAAATPYEYYNYQPVTEVYKAQNTKIFDTLIGTAEPYDAKYDPYSNPTYETQSSEDVPSQFQGKGCKKVASDDDSNCFVCENEKTNAKYTQCNYKSKKDPVNYYSAGSSKYSMPHNEEGSGRYKRYADSGENDPYTLIKSRSLKSFDSPSIPADYGLGFQYEGEHYDESKPELSYSEQQAEALKKSPQNCKQEDRKGMTCTVCLDPKTGGNFEQCSYTSAPKEKKYAYVTEKKYDNDEPEETKTVPETKTIELTGESKPTPSSSSDREDTDDYESRVRQEKSPRKRNEEGYSDYSSKPSEKQQVSDKEYEVPSHFSSTKSNEDHRGSGSESSENRDGSKSGKLDYTEDFSDFDEYHFKFFPEFAKQESRQEDVKENYQIPEATKQNVESVLAEFSKKDRSNCKKAEKKGMTCYLCVDKNNIQHEECMYVQESRPQSTHVAYHEVKAVKDKNGKPVEAKGQPEFAESKRKHFFKKVTTPAPLTLQASASEEVGTFVAAPPALLAAASEEAGAAVNYNEEDEEKLEEKSSNKEEKELKESASDFDDESDRINDKTDPTIKTPAEFAVGAEEGVYSEETRPVYSKALGVKLPKYMLDKSEFEKEFDDFAGSF